MIDKVVRTVDEYNEEYSHKPLDQAYHLLGLDTYRTPDKEHQVHGVDLFLCRNGSLISVDEKADFSRTLCVDNPYRDATPTFALELNFENKAGYRRNGWFHPDIRKNLRNNYYAFLWFNAEKEKEYDRYGHLKTHTRLIQIHSLELCLIGVDKLASLVSSTQPFDYDKIIADCLYQGNKRMIEMQNDISLSETAKRKPIPFNQYRDMYPNIYRLTYSPAYAEKPLNIVFSKLVMRQNATLDYAFQYSGENGNEVPIAMKNIMSNPTNPAETEWIAL